jgi:predicted DNA-binding transcriptional regulator AlpA
MPDQSDSVAPKPDQGIESSAVLTLLRRIADAVEAGRTAVLDPAEAANFLGISVSKLHELNSRGLVPEPARIGDSDRLPRWTRAELQAWLLAGAPARGRWQAMRESALRRWGAA